MAAAKRKVNKSQLIKARVPLAFKRKFVRQARQEGESESVLVRRAIAQYLKKQRTSR
jgi:hypothetical protein